MNTATPASPTTPADVHYRRAAAIQAQRAAVLDAAYAALLDAAYAAHPERFVRRPPTPLPLPDAAWINKPKEDTPRLNESLSIESRKG